MIGTIVLIFLRLYISFHTTYIMVIETKATKKLKKLFFGHIFINIKTKIQINFIFL